MGRRLAYARLRRDPLLVLVLGALAFAAAELGVLGTWMVTGARVPVLSICARVAAGACQPVACS
jgi:hypothetical protein